MQGNGNNFKTLFRKMYFMLLPTNGQRSKYIMRHANLFRNVGKDLFFQSRKFPSDPELISFGNNVFIASDVSFVNHDVIHAMLNKKYNTSSFKALGGSIKIGDNVMIGSRTIIMPDIEIGSNVIIAAGSIITKDIPDNCIAGGIPAKVIGDFQSLVNKRKNLTTGIKEGADKIWKEFFNKRDKYSET